MNEQPAYTLKINEQQLAVVVAALQEIPFKHAAPVLQEIDQQVTAQREKGVPEEHPRKNGKAQKKEAGTLTAA
jgi:hypothetical protein